MPLAESVYDFLNIGRKPVRSDRIFVLAGSRESRQFAVKLWRVGFAPELVLSVPRCECGQFSVLGIPDGGLRQLVESSPAEQSYFLVRLTPEGAAASAVKPGRYGMRTQARALAGISGPRTSLLAVSRPIHVRMAALTLRRALPGVNIELVAPEDTPATSQQIWREFRRYLTYLVVA